MAKKVGIAFLAVATFFAIYIFGRFDPATTPFPKCPFFWATGLKCPGCGTQRAIHQLLHGDIGAAFQYNAAMVLSIPLLVFLFSASLLQDKFPRYYRTSHNPVFSWILMACILLWWVLRNVFGW